MLYLAYVLYPREGAGVLCLPLCALMAPYYSHSGIFCLMDIFPGMTKEVWGRLRKFSSL